MKAVLAFVLAGLLFTAGIYLFHNKNEIRLNATTIPQSTITLYDYMDCVTTTCADLKCADDDKQCLGASQNYQTCFAASSQCQQWYADEYKNLNDDDLLPADFFQCDKQCRPAQASSKAYWQIYSCQAMCGGIKTTPVKAPAPVQATTPAKTTITLFDYMDCVTTTCANMECAADDKQCMGASQNYQTCFANSDQCQQWYQDEYKNLNDDDLLPADFFNCDKQCRPAQASSKAFWQLYSCQAMCGGIKTTPVKATPVSTITLYDYMNCVTTTCANQVCADNDTTCLGASQNYQTCFAKSSQCQQWYEDEYKNLNSDDLLPSDFFQCDKECRPAKASAGNYYSLYSCQAKCGGIKL